MAARLPFLFTDDSFTAADIDGERHRIVWFDTDRQGYVIEARTDTGRRFTVGRTDGAAWAVEMDRPGPLDCCCDTNPGECPAHADEVEYCPRCGRPEADCTCYQAVPA